MLPAYSFEGGRAHCEREKCGCWLHGLSCYSLMTDDGYQRSTAEEHASSPSSPSLYAFLPFCLLKLPEHQREMNPALQVITFHAYIIQLNLILSVKPLLDLSKGPPLYVLLHCLQRTTAQLCSSLWD